MMSLVEVVVPLIYALITTVIESEGNVSSVTCIESNAYDDSKNDDTTTSATTDLQQSVLTFCIVCNIISCGMYLFFIDFVMQYTSYAVEGDKLFIETVLAVAIVLYKIEAPSR